MQLEIVRDGDTIPFLDAYNLKIRFSVCCHSPTFVFWYNIIHVKALVFNGYALW